VIIASSGMCDAGRVRHHLKRLLWRDDATVLITGFQAIGTLGRLLQDGRTRVRIQGDEVKVRARIRSIDVYSGHADAAGLVAWAQARKPRGAVFLNHGEPESLDGLRRRLVKAGVGEERVVIAELDQSYRLKPTAQPEQELRQSRVPKAAMARLDWHNQRSEFLTRLNAALERAGDDAAREALLSKLAGLLEAPIAPDQNAEAPPA
jgi:metallo-beta-lactamase family protein